MKGCKWYGLKKSLQPFLTSTMTYKFKQKSPLSHESFYDTAVLAVISIIKPDNFYFVPIS